MKLNLEHPVHPDWLQLDFTPQSIRDHYTDLADDQEMDYPDKDAVSEKYTDAELAEAAFQMLTEDYTWNLFDYMMDRIIEILQQSEGDS